jgi:hypothetical protein
VLTGLAVESTINNSGLNDRVPPPPLPIPLPPIPALPINYYTPAVDPGPEEWVAVARLATTGQWHQARAALARGHIESLMGEGEDLPAGAEIEHPWEGIVLKVPKSQVERAALILEHCRTGKRWCTRCGSADLETRRLPWYWVIWSVLFLGIAPFCPARWICRNCGKKID